MVSTLQMVLHHRTIRNKREPLCLQLRALAARRPANVDLLLPYELRSSTRRSSGGELCVLYELELWSTPSNILLSLVWWLASSFARFLTIHISVFRSGWVNLSQHYPSFILNYHIHHERTHRQRYYHEERFHCRWQ